jgi:hypothetical protein
MHMRNLAIVLGISLLGLLPACAVNTHYLQSGAEIYQPVPPEQVEVFVKAPAGRQYIVIGAVAVDQVGKAETAIKALQKEAGNLGANAIINLKLTVLHSFSSGRSGASGVAVFLQ